MCVCAGCRVAIVLRVFLDFGRRCTFLFRFSVGVYFRVGYTSLCAFFVLSFPKL